MYISNQQICIGILFLNLNKHNFNIYLFLAQYG